MPEDGTKGSFARWQSITIGQFTYAINLLLSFSVATLGFQLTLMLNPNFNPTSWQICALLLSLALLLASLVFGVGVVINRLREFRATMGIARQRERLEREGMCRERINKELESDRKSCLALDKRTWILFSLQVGTFGFGVFFTVLSVLALASVIHKLL